MASRAPGLKGLTPGSPAAATGLAAVGGPRGTAAAAIRILVEFVSNYDRQAIEKLKADIASTQKLQEKNARTVNNQVKQRVALEREIAKAQEYTKNRQLARIKLLDAEGKATSNLLKDAEDILKLNEQITKQRRNKQKFTDLEAEREKQIAALLDKYQKSGAVFDRNAARNALIITELRQKLAAVNAKIASSQKVSNRLLEEQRTLETQLNALSSLRVNALQRVGGLLVGVLGYTVAGTAFAVGFQAIQGVIDGITNGLQLMIDPLRDVREGWADLREEIEKISSDEGLSKIEAAQKIIDRLGALAPVIGVKAQQLVDVSTIDEINKKIEDYIKLQQNSVDIEKERENQIRRIRDAVAEFLRQQYGSYTAAARALGDTRNLGSQFENSLSRSYVLVQANNQALEIYKQLTGEAVDQTEAWAEALAKVTEEATSDEIERAFDAKIKQVEQARDGVLALGDAFQEIKVGLAEGISSVVDQVNNAVTDEAVKRLEKIRDNLEVHDSQRTKTLQKAIDNLGDGESALTRQLAAAIERLNAAEERRQYLAQLADIAEQRHAILLERRLRNTEREIQINKFAGADRLIAINAEIDKLNDLNAFQDRQIQQLELIKQLQTPLERNRGEAVTDFISRRALENRKLLVQFEQFQRAGKISNLQDRAKQVEENIQLQQLAEQRLEIIRQRQLDQRLKSLQQQLDASQEADQKALEARRDALQKELELSQKADQQRLDDRRAAIDQHIQDIKDESEKLHKEQEDRKDRSITTAKTENKRLNELITARTEFQLDALKRSKAEVLRLASQTESALYLSAARGATTRAQLALVAGQMFGANQGYGTIDALVKSLGLSDDISKLLLANARNFANTVTNQYRKLNMSKPAVQTAAGYAKGGVFELHNGMSPFGQNVRFGEQGTEIGVVLSNRVTQALKESRGGPLIGSVTLPTSNPRQAEYRIRRMVREEARNAVSA